MGVWEEWEDGKMGNKRGVHRESIHIEMGECLVEALEKENKWMGQGRHTPTPTSDLQCMYNFRLPCSPLLLCSPLLSFVLFISLLVPQQSSP